MKHRKAPSRARAVSGRTGAILAGGASLLLAGGLLVGGAAAADAAPGDQTVTARVDFRDPSCADESAGWAAFVNNAADAENDGVTFAITSGTATADSDITVTATAAAGYQFSGGLTTQTFTHSYTAVPTNCGTSGSETTAVTPVVTFKDATCDKPNRATWSGTQQSVVDYAVEGTVAPGETVSVTATIKPEQQADYSFAAGATTTWTHTFVTVEQLAGSAGGAAGGSAGVGASGSAGASGSGTVAGAGALSAGASGQAGAAGQAGTSYGAETSVPTVVNAGLAGSTTPSWTQRAGQGALALGLMLLAAAAWLTFGRRTAAGHHRA